MDIEIKYALSFSTAFVTLKPGETVTAESDAMASMSGHTVMKTRFNGGFFSGLMKKFFGGESLFVNDFICPHDAAKPVEVVLTQPTPGDMKAYELNGESIMLTPGSWPARRASSSASAGLDSNPGSAVKLVPAEGFGQRHRVLWRVRRRGREGSRRRIHRRHQPLTGL